MSHAGFCPPSQFPCSLKIIQFSSLTLAEVHNEADNEFPAGEPDHPALMCLNQPCRSKHLYCSLQRFSSPAASAAKKHKGISTEVLCALHHHSVPQAGCCSYEYFSLKHVLQFPMGYRYLR